MNAKSVLLACALAAGLAGCNVETSGCPTCTGPGACAGGGAPSPGADTSKADASCVPFCNRIEYCGLISAANLQACLDRCRAAYAANPQMTQSGCSCVTSDFCRPPDGSDGSYECPGAPLVTDGDLADGGAGSTGTTGWGTSSSSGTTGWGGASSSSSSSSSCSSGSVSGSGSSSGSGASAGSSSSSGTTAASPDGGATCTRNQDCALNEDCVGGVCLTRCHASCDCAANQTCDADGYCEYLPPPQTSCQTDCDCPSGHSCVNGWCN